MTSFANNQWYVAAYGEEVGRELLARTIFGEPLVLYRTEEGAAVALADRCVHRRFPLSESRLDGDRIVCGYHGFTYDDGRSLRLRAGAEAHPAHRPRRRLPGRRAGLVRLGVDRRPGPRRPAAIPRAPWLADPG